MISKIHTGLFCFTAHSTCLNKTLKSDRTEVLMCQSMLVECKCPYCSWWLLIDHASEL